MVSSERPTHTLPALFATNELCYDSKELHGLTFNKKLKPVTGPAREHWQDEMSLTLKPMNSCTMEPRSGP